MWQAIFDLVYKMLMSEPCGSVGINSYIVEECRKFKSSTTQGKHTNTNLKSSWQPNVSAVTKSCLCRY